MRKNMEDVKQREPHGGIETHSVNLPIEVGHGPVNMDKSNIPPAPKYQDGSHEPQESAPFEAK